MHGGTPGRRACRTCVVRPLGATQGERGAATDSISKTTDSVRRVGLSCWRPARSVRTPRWRNST